MAIALNVNGQVITAGVDFVADSDPSYSPGFTLTDGANTVTAVGTDAPGNAISLWFPNSVDMSGLLTNGATFNFTTYSDHTATSSISVSLFDSTFSSEAILSGLNWSDSTLVSSPLVAASIDLTDVQNMVIDMQALGNRVNVDLISFCIGMPIGPNPPVINLLNEYLLVQNLSLIHI